MAHFLWICLGGAAGTGARYLVSLWLAQRLGPGFAWWTLAVNALGSFLLCALMVAGSRGDLVTPTAHAALATGVLGGFTTYSTFNYETFEYLRQGGWWLAGANVSATVLVCLLAGLLGHAGARWLLAAG